MKVKTMLSRKIYRHLVARYGSAFAIFLIASISSSNCVRAAAAERINLANFAVVTTSFVSPHETLAGINFDLNPRNSNDKSGGAYGNWPRHGTQWVQYEWTQPISTSSVSVYWFDDHNGVRLPQQARLYAWDGKQFARVEHAEIALKENASNAVQFSELSTTKLRLEMDAATPASTGVLQWRVTDSGKSPHFPPVVRAGVDRSVVLPGATYLNGFVKGLSAPGKTFAEHWGVESGPGAVQFVDPNNAITSATFAVPGDYVLKLTADDGSATASDTLKLTAWPAPPSQCLQSVRTASWQVRSPLWTNRLKVLITHWIPHCVAVMSDPKLPQGGIENFVNAAHKLAGGPFEQNRGPVYCNAWVYNNVEAMCYAQMLDAQGDQEIVDAQKRLRETLDEWVPKILAAQESDGYLDTYYTLHGLPRWTRKGDHEGYNAGYFIEAAIAHYEMTGRRDSRMFAAACKLADCWVLNVGPDSKRTWYDGHEEIEQALMKLARLRDEVDGAHAGDKYVGLAKHLLDDRGHDAEYDQSHLPVTYQYEAVGHAVRAVYLYAGMAAVATETGDVDYLSSVRSIWDDIVDKKYYITGGVGSGETSEGFGKNYSLPNNAYCESCSGCGELFFQHNMQLAYHDARYANLYEGTLYNAILSDFDLAGDNFTYTNSLDTSETRYPWHDCPCCVGNIPRTLLQLPTWMYSKGTDGLYVNLYVGSTVTVPDVAGVNVEMIQETDYPRTGTVSITVKPSQSKNFAVRLRVPSSDISRLYAASPSTGGIQSVTVNGVVTSVVLKDGYVVIDRLWTADKTDIIKFELPMQVQRVKATDQVHADRGRVALKYGPLIFNFESVDQNLDSVLDPASPLTVEYRPDLLGGVTVVHGTSTDGKPLTAIPNYVRNNRGGRSMVWIKDR